MSVLAALEHEPLRREAFLRHCKTQLAVGSPEHDWTQNGWPVHELKNRLEQGAKHGRGAPGWSHAESPDGKPLVTAEIPCGVGFIHVALDPASGQCAFKSSQGAREAASLDEAARLLARESHQESVRARRLSPASASHWQGKAAQALSDVEPGRAIFHPKRGVDGAQAWQEDFDAIDDHCQALPNPVAEMDRLRSHYAGAAPEQTAAWLREDLKGPITEIAGQKTRMVALGAQGSQLRAAIPVKPNGSVDPESPIVAALGVQSSEGFRLANPGDEPMRFYNFAAFSQFCASAQTLDVATPDGPDVAARLEARRASSPAPSRANGMRV